MTHSPGTWRFNPDRGEVLSDQPVHDGDDSLQHGYDGYVVAETVARANGPVLASAPDLLAELRLIVEGWSRKGRDLTEWESERLEFALVALAKAEGRDA